MPLERPRTILGYFGFDRTDYGADGGGKNGNRKWWHELREERIKDIETELEIFHQAYFVHLLVELESLEEKGTRIS